MLVMYSSVVLHRSRCFYASESLFKNTNCNPCDFALLGCVYVCVCTVSVGAKERKSVQNGQPYPVRNCVCQRWEQESVWECMRAVVCLLLFSWGRLSGSEQRGGIITEAVTFLWFLWFQHEAGSLLSLSACTPAWKLLATIHDILSHFNLWDFHYRAMNLCLYNHLLLEH